MEVRTRQLDSVCVRHETKEELLGALQRIWWCGDDSRSPSSPEGWCGVRRVFFVGSMYAKHIPICTLVIPRRVFDRAGIVSLETTGSMSLPTQSINALESSLKSLNLEKLERLVALKEQQPRQLSWKT